MAPGSVDGGGSVMSSHQGSGVMGSSRPGHESEDFKDDKFFEGAVMGVMYTVCKEKATYGYGFIAFRLLVDWLQLWLLIVTPTAFNIPSDKLWWRIISWISLNQFMSTRGYTFFLVTFYLLVFGLVLSVVLSVWVGLSFQANKFDYVWPITTLKIFAKVFYQIFDVASMSLFLIALDCQLFARPDNQIGYNQEFPDVKCWAMPHLVHAFIAIISLAAFVLLAGLFSVGEMELDFTTKNQIAMMHTGVELHLFIIRFLMTCTGTFVSNPEWASVAQLLLSFWLFYLVSYWQPQLEGWVNHIRAGSYLTITWVSLLWLWSAFSLGWDPNDQAAVKQGVEQITIVMWVTTIPMGVLGYILSWVRLRGFRIDLLSRFRDNLEETSVRYQFTDARFVEVLARCCRVKREEKELDPAAVALAESILQVGLNQLPKDPFMAILFSSFLMDVLNSTQSGYAQLEAAGRLEPGFLMRFAIFSRQQQHAQRSAAGGMSAGSADLVSYVELQRSYGLALKTHKEALAAITRFWECLLHQNVEFKKLARCVQVMDEDVRAADRVYKQVLQRHSTNVKMVRLYAKFMEHVKQDPWAAARWFAEADRLEAAEQEARNNDTLSGLDVADPKLHEILATGFRGSGHDSRGAIIMNAQSILLMSNQRACDILGYSRAEMKDKNVNVILPPQIADIHPTFIRNYITTGVEHVMDKVMQQVALHKDRRLVPVNVTVMKLRGSGEDMLVLAVLTEIPQEPDEATIWVTPAGAIMGVCSNYQDWFGFKPKEIQHTPVVGLACKEGKAFEEALHQAHDALMGQKRTRASLEPAKTKKPQPPPTAPPTGGMRKGVPSMTGPEPATLRHQTSTIQATSESGSETPPPMQTSTSIVVRQAAADAVPTTGDVSAPPKRASRFGPQSFESNVTSGVSKFGTVLRGTLSGGEADTAALNKQQLTQVQEVEGEGFPLEWHAYGIPLAHKYAEEPVPMDIKITNAGMASLQFHVVTIRKPMSRTATSSFNERMESSPPSMLQLRSQPNSGLFNQLQNASMLKGVKTSALDLMIVVNTRGQVVHMTALLAELLGRTKQRTLGQAASFNLESLMVEPFAQLHRVHMQAPATATWPPYSCRSGMSVLLQVQVGHGRQQPMAFKLDMRRKQDADDTYHVIQLEEIKMEQAKDERRLRIELDEQGNVIANLGTSNQAALFGFDPEALVGTSVMSFLDILRPTGYPYHADLTETDGDEAFQALMGLVSTAYADPGSSWRVGVISPQDKRSGSNANMKGILSGHPKPAIMRLLVDASDASPDAEQSVTITMELWRADLVTSVLDLDSAGMILPPDTSELGTAISELYPGDLSFGLTLGQMTDKHVSALLPALGRRPLTDLFVPNALGPGPEANRSKAKNRRQPSDPRTGPQQIVTLIHPGDASEIKLCIQAVRKTGTGSGIPAISLIVHPVRASAGRRNFTAWANHAAEAAAFADKAATTTTDPYHQDRSTISATITQRPPASPLPNKSNGVQIHSDALRDKPRLRIRETEDGLEDRPSLSSPAAVNNMNRRSLTANLSAVRRASRASQSDLRHLAPPGEEEEDEEEEGQSMILKPRAPSRGASQLSLVSSIKHGAVGRYASQASSLGSNPSVRTGEGAVGARTDSSTHGGRGVAGLHVRRDSARPVAKDHDKDDEKDDGSDHEFGEKDADRVNTWLSSTVQGDDDIIPTRTSVAQPSRQGPLPNNNSAPQAYMHKELESEPFAHQPADDDVDSESMHDDEHSNIHVPDDAQASAYTVDDSDFQRGQRFRKVYRLLSSAMVQKPITNYQAKAWLVAASIVAVQLAAFIAMFVELKVGSSLVHDLSKLGDGGMAATEIATFTRTLNMLYDNLTSPTLRSVTGLNDVPYVKQLLKTAIDDFQLLHKGLYLGFEQPRSLPNKFGLQPLWDDEVHVMNSTAIIQGSQATGNFTTQQVYFHYQNMSLWQAGNAFVQKANSLYQNSEAYYQQDQNGNMSFSSQPDLLWIVTNVPAVIFPGYLATQDAYLQLVMDQMQKINNVQVIPSGLIRRLATSKYNLEEDEDADEGDEDEGLDLTKALPLAETKSISFQVRGDQPYHTAGSTKDGLGSVVKSGLDLAGQDDTPQSAWQRLFPCFGGRRKNPAELAASNTNKTLVPGKRTTLKLIAPIIAWGALVIIANGIGYFLLELALPSISQFNIVNYVAILYNRNNFFIQELTYEPEPSRRDQYRSETVQRISELALQYSLMLYGNQVAPNETSFHFTSVTTGVAHSGAAGAATLFSSDACLCLNQTECQPEDSHLYPDTRTGLDRMMLKYLEISGTIKFFQYLDPYINGPEYDFYWNTIPDMKGGFEALVKSYESVVMANIQSVSILHLIVFVLTLAIVAFFILCMLRPFIKATQNETRRIAELLSQLPVEVDVSSVLQRTLLLDMGMASRDKDKDKDKDKEDTANNTMGSKKSVTASGKSGRF